ncbi:MAG: fibronectin type III domain-containing protein, partial [Bacteroidaceae bacterium]|nr:fibronectin type III domain-containing protein [Bacteroidaceae bacterium]
MYNKQTYARRGRPWQVMLLLALLAWLLPQRAAAEEYVHDPDHYSVSLGGTNIVYFTAPIYDQKNVDQWICDGNLRVSVEGATPTTIFSWKSAEENISGDATEVSTKFSTTADGFFDITLGNTNKTTRLTKAASTTVKIKRNTDGYSYTFEAEWVVPYNLLGKKLEFSWDVERYGNSVSWGHAKVTGLKNVTINMPEASAKLTPFLSSPMMDPNTPGKLQLPWFVTSDSITKVWYEYTDATGKYHKVDLATQNNGFIVIDANVPHKGLRLMCNYKAIGDKGSYEIEGVGSSPQNVPFIHAPVGLVARPLDDRTPKVELTWSVPYPDDEDLTPTDFFEIQRSLTGKEEDFKTISSSTFYAQNDKKTDYAYVDSTLLEAIQTSMLAGGGTLDHLTYRVRRTITENWGWSASNNCATTAMCVMDNLHLLRIQNYSAQWEDSLAYTVRVAWQYADEHGAVWDDRAKMVLRVISKNRDGEQVDSMVYILNSEDRAQRYKVVNLTRSCVYYDVDLYVERDKSPINQLADVTEYYFSIRSEADWDTFRQKVLDANGQDVAARLYADITITKSCGDDRHPFRGTFDGNGHTLTININNDASYQAPFRYVGNAAFRNLRTAGTVQTAGLYAGGLVGNITDGSNVTIDNCRVSVTLNSSTSGETGNGGIVVRLGEKSTVAIRTSKFDGAFEGAESSHIGGFIGFCQDKSTAVIDNCLFAPDHIDTKADDCKTWARGSGDFDLTVTNSFATREYVSLVIIRNAADWHTFAVKVNDAKGQYDVDAILAADVTTSEHVGVTEGAVYRGTFDGNGHTLTFNKDWTENERFIAPFRHASNATIKNLHVAGTIKSGQMYPAGLIAQVINGTTTIENCRSSVTLNGTMTGEGTLAGFVGRVSNSKVTISNSKFDGSFEGDKSIGNGGFIAWVDEKSSATIKNCLFMPVSVKTDPEKSATWARQDERGTVSVSNCYATEEFCHIINDALDWNKYRTALSNRGTKSVNAILNADITVSASAVNLKGLFDGNAHTLNLNGTDGTFISGEDYTIQNLHVTGSAGGGQHVAGLVGSSTRGNIQSCWVSVGIHCNTTHAGGFIGHAHDTQHYINNCLFDGTVSTKNDGTVDGTSYVGAFIGWAGGADNHVTNCLDDGKYYYVDHAGFCYKGSGDAWGNTGNSTNNYTYKGVSWNEVNYSGINHSSVDKVVEKLGSSNWYVDGENALPKMAHRDLWNNVGSLSASELVSRLGTNWQVDGDKVVPVMASSLIGASDEELAQYFTSGWTVDDTGLNPITTTVEYRAYATINDENLKLKHVFYHKNNGTIDETLLTQTRQSSVLLSWSTDNNPVDYFRVMRRVQGQGNDKWTEVVTNLTDMSYEDTSVSPLLTYEYKVQAVNDCEGRDSTETRVTVGECKHTGRVEGYVRFNDGTGAPEVTVSIKYDGKELTTVKTDESGYFEVDELSYYGGTKVEYEVGPVAERGINIDAVLVTFDASSNNRTLREFTIENGRRFSGYVMYDGTSIPVKGVNFLVDGNRIHNAQGKYVETDYDGSFSFRVLDGQHTIQAVMDKHVFTNDGWYKNSGKQNFNADIAGIYFYDDTKVTLTGRVVGGDDQGLKPLMNNLSQNNLGDSLTMVLTLEGDNTSWLVYDNQHPNRTQREEVVNHPVKGEDHYTTVRTERKRMTVWPDAKTGEYTLQLPPVRWKVQQVYCSGYPTLFQEGQVSEVIDLTNALDTVKVRYDGTYYDADEERVENPTAQYHAVYNRIYHSPVEVTYKQVGYDSFDYFGDKSYASSELTGETVQVPLVYSVRKPNWPANRKDSLVAVYTLGHPVFSIERQYYIQLQVAERYLYNNDPLGRVDMVPLKGGMAYMHNGMRALSFDDLNTIREPQKLDSLGQCVFTLKADQTSNMSDCLRTVTFTVMRDSTYIEAEPLQAYVLNMFPVGAGQDVMTEGAPILYDILRDPPGAYSTNTLAKGATINFTYAMNCSITAGPIATIKYGEKLETITATVHTINTSEGLFNGISNGTAIGPVNLSDAVDTNIDMFVYNGNGSKAFSHTMVLGNNVSTSGDPSMVGADADLYIGSVQNVTVTPMSTIRVVTNDQLTKMAARLGKSTIELLNEGTKVESELGKKVDYGSVSVIATGMDAQGKPIHLVRDVALGYGPKIQSNFVYSQKQLLTQIIPQKAKEIVDMMFLGTKEEAQKIADRTKKAVYLSLRQPTDTMFAVVNKKVDGKVDGHPYNRTIEKAEEGINYLVVLPTNASEQDYSDEVEEKYQIIKAWMDMIARNESEKLQVRDRVNNFDVAGAAGVNYSETFDASYSSSWSNFFPIGTEVDYFGKGSTASNFSSAAGIAGSLAMAIGLSLIEMKAWSNPSADKVNVNDDNGMKSSVTFSGTLVQWSLFPMASYTTVGADSEARSYNRTESFTLACDPASHLNVDVYRAYYNGDGDYDKDLNITDVFTGDNFYNFYEMVAGRVGTSLNAAKMSGPRGFIFRTRGGATQNPWEDQRVTQVYNPGAVLDARTLKIVNPTIRMDKQSVSGVAIDDAARFTVYVGNDSEKPEATDGLTLLQVFALDQMNPQGAKMSINGQPLTTAGITVTCIPGTETALQLEVRAGQGFDYENLVVGVMSPSDAEHTYALAPFDVHFLREAGGVNIAVPGDKWVLNTNAQQDSKRGWYLPVHINGFDRHQHNFDHIEFQYKESQRGDDSWTNLCSYYADAELMAKANGVRELMKENANITTEFYGEGWTMERAYDL